MNISVIGAGTMGNGIAHVFAQAGQQTQQAITEREREKTQYKGNVDLQKTAMKEDTKKALSKEKLV